MTYVAWDIETCPLSPDAYSDAHRARHKAEYEYRMRTERDLILPEAKQKAGAMHPFLGWICCISLVSGNASRIGTPKSWTAASPDDEADVLDAFWDFLDGLASELQGVRWVTFNGKRFDVPFLVGRSMKHDLAPTCSDLLDTYPYSQSPHVDLANLLQHTFYSLADLCDHLGIESPKDGFDGSDVAPAVADGRVDEVRAYCERDVVATLRCVQRVRAYL